MPVAERIVPHLPPDALASWDTDLAARIADRDAAEAGRRAAGRWFYSMTGQWRDLRQMIAAAGGNLDRLIAIEMEKPEKDWRTLDIAARLLDAGRVEEALDWVRRGGLSVHFSLRDFDDGAERSPAVRQADLEARILCALGRKTDAAVLLWQRFTETLSPELLRAHLKLLPDFDDMEAEEKAMAFVLQQPEAMAALDFFMSWPRHDLAARLIVERHAGWAGRDWHVLPEVADRLQHEYPLATTILFRALLDDILGRARSKAYSHGARYLHQLDLIAEDADAARPSDIPSHVEYREKLRAAHGRKIGFWTQAGETVPSSRTSEFRGRAPR
ncbi:hypothetical protein D2T29_21900 [Sinirhodobacter populi]|uniref:Uncharacterized protein n=1 Tax=Paenirhodobacter populi TaxID=2306993 RepID=A0A443JYJ7_9RHOB|nr:DUF6880 family protein [Sinirhodobacter populi]RWR25592.1 hypothetical protein D2T29_21900 [Sinirhodobacter populi]